MSMADRFPDLDLTLPAWLLNAPDEPFDSVDLARRAALEDLRVLDPLAHAPSSVDLHLIGPGMANGAVSSEVATLFGLFQAEVNAASDSDDERWTTMRLVGSSPGSVILHLAPVAVEEEVEEEPRTTGSFPIPSGRTFDAAVGRVLDLHDRFERRRAIDTDEVKRPLREAARRFVGALDALNTAVEVDAFTAEGHRRRSSLSSEGRSFAVSQFAPIEGSGIDLIYGELQSVDLTGKIVIRGKSGPRPKVATKSGALKRRQLRNYEIRGVPVELIRSARLLPGRFYGVQVIDRTARDPMNTKSYDDFQFVGLNSLEEIAGDVDTE